MEIYLMTSKFPHLYEKAAQHATFYGLSRHTSPKNITIRKGDSLSMLLFTVYLDTLLQKISQICNDTTDMITVYADDITVIVDSNGKVNEIS
jgi:hypothetical protein